MGVMEPSEQLASAEGSVETSKAAIARVAKVMFTEHGFAPTSVRAIAAAANIDPALVIRYFGSKEELFLETISMEGQFGTAIDGPLEGMGTRIIAHLLSGDRAKLLRTYAALLGASEREEVRSRLEEAMESLFIRPIAPRLKGSHRELRARLIAAQVGGLLTSLAILHDQTLLAENKTRLTKLYGRALQHLINDN